VYTPFHEESKETGTKIWNAVANALILMVVIVIMTVVLILLYKYRCYEVGKSFDYTAMQIGGIHNGKICEHTMFCPSDVVRHTMVGSVGVALE
jgi:membrane protein YdbS with pleckstrin-like domain